MNTTEARPGRGRVPIGKLTSYELAAVHPDGRRVLLAYAQRRSRQTIWAVLVDRVDSVRRVLGTIDIEFANRAADGATMGEWRIVWTGRTQRDARDEGELPYVEDL